MEALVAGRRGLRRIRAAPADDDACCDTVSMGSLCAQRFARLGLFREVLHQRVALSQQRLIHRIEDGPRLGPLVAVRIWRGHREATAAPGRLCVLLRPSAMISRCFF